MPLSPSEGMTPFLLRVAPLISPLDRVNLTDDDRRVFDQYVRAVKASGVKATQEANSSDLFTQASILDAAMYAVEPQRLWVTFDNITARRHDGKTIPVASLPHDRSFGSVVPPDEKHAVGVPQWWISSHVQSLSQYGIIATSYNGWSRDVIDEMIHAHSLGEESVYVRIAEKDSAVVPVSASPHANNLALIEAFGWEIARASGGYRNILVTPVVEMTKEYRVWVIDGKPVAGAGIIEGADARLNDGSAFDPYVVNKRGERPEKSYPSDVASIESMVEVARVLGTATVRDGDGILPTSFVVDTAIVDGYPTIVDVNSLSGTALYGVDPYRILRALA